MAKKLMDKSPVRAMSPHKENPSKLKSFGKRSEGSRVTVGKNRTRSRSRLSVKFCP